MDDVVRLMHLDTGMSVRTLADLQTVSVALVCSAWYRIVRRWSVLPFPRVLVSQPSNALNK